MEKPTRQEMFNRAFIGLRSQNWEHCLNDLDSCVYSDRSGKHCAWGWVDLSLVGEETGMENLTIGIAGLLDADERQFATDLQTCHDDATGPTDMESRLRAFAEDNELTVPEGDEMSEYKKMLDKLEKAKNAASAICSLSDKDAIDTALDELSKHVKKLQAEAASLKLFRGGPNDR